MTRRFLEQSFLKDGHRDFSVRRKKRGQIAKEAARLLYYHLVDDYKSAKQVAGNSLGIKSLPKNIDVARELDKLAEEIEGSSRVELLIDMRRKALQVMDNLIPFNPRLVGSVWRGTSKRGSDIDLTVYSENREIFVDIIQSKYRNVKTEWKTKTAKGMTNEYFHVYFTISPDYVIEIVVLNPEEMHNQNKCEIYGDVIIGLSRFQLAQLIKMDATKKFIPEEKKNG